jgi:hypothetical protein
MALSIKTKEDLDHLIESEIPEDYQLEYKAAAKIKDKDGIGKSVSSMANAAGGVIVIGMNEGDGKRPGPIDPVTDRIDEYLDQVIGSRIAPPPTCRIHSIQVDGGYVYVVEVEQGDTAHQLKADGRYHRRENTTTRWMQDYEIRDAMGRQRGPVVNVKFERLKKRLLIYLSNDGYVVARDVRCQLNFPRHFLQTGLSTIIQLDGKEFYSRDTFAPRVIHPKSEIMIADDILLRDDVFASLESNQAEREDEFPILWKVWADNAPVRESQVYLSKVKNNRRA